MKTDNSIPFKKFIILSMKQLFMPLTKINVLMHFMRLLKVSASACKAYA